MLTNNEESYFAEVIATKFKTSKQCITGFIKLRTPHPEPLTHDARKLHPQMNQQQLHFQ
jgi:hypothetical protein